MHLAHFMTFEKRFRCCRQPTQYTRTEDGVVITHFYSSPSPLLSSAHLLFLRHLHCEWRFFTRRGYPQLTCWFFDIEIVNRFGCEETQRRRLRPAYVQREHEFTIFFSSFCRLLLVVVLVFGIRAAGCHWTWLIERWNRAKNMEMWFGRTDYETEMQWNDATHLSFVSIDVEKIE